MADYMFVLNSTEETQEFRHPDIGHPVCTAILASNEGRLYVMDLPVSGTVLRIPAGVAVRLPSYLGAHAVRRAQFWQIPAERFYSRGHQMPDGYALADENAVLQAELAKAVAVIEATETERAELKAEVTHLKKEVALAKARAAKKNTPIGGRDALPVPASGSPAPD